LLRTASWRLLLAGLLLAVADPGWHRPAIATEQEHLAGGLAEEPITPIPQTPPPDPEKVSLGQRLFHDSRLSHANVAACSSCHALERGGDDDTALNVGADGRPLDFNAPTILNVALNFRFNWRGNFRSLEAQNEAALLDPRIMNTSWKELLNKLRADPGYKQAFARAYGGAPDRRRVLDALASYERALLTPDARFDRYLRGDGGAITFEELKGYRLFKGYGCIACHQGVGVGGNLFQRFGIFQDPFAGRPVTPADLGRFALTGAESDRHVFRVPSLRNVALTAPYLHDGSARTLHQAVAIMARSQLGRPIAEGDIDLIVGFLRTLTGQHRQGPASAAGRPAEP
jgi:cytochrome c peroxidase